MAHPNTPAMLANAKLLTDATFTREIEESTGLTIVDFAAAWCPPCRLLEPILDDIAAAYPEVRIVAIDTDANVATSARFNVRTVPTMLFFKNGQLVDRIVGVVPKGRIEAAIARHA